MNFRLIRFYVFLFLFYLNGRIVAQFGFDYTCQQLFLEVQEYIYTELNYCISDTDCIIARGICPLSPYFIVNKERAWEMDSLSNLLTQKCRGCTYDLPILPRNLKIECRNNKGCPSLKFLKYAPYFDLNCKQIVSLYGKDLIGQSIDSFDLPGYMFRILNVHDTTTIDPREVWTLNLIEIRMDDLCIIQELRCNN